MPERHRHSASDELKSQHRIIVCVDYRYQSLWVDRIVPNPDLARLRIAGLLVADSGNTVL